MDESEAASANGAEAPRAMPVKDLRTRSRELAQEALKTLQSIMTGKAQASVRLAAAREVLDRGYGRTPAPRGRAAAKPKAEGAAPYTVVVQRFSDPPDPKLEDFD